MPARTRAELKALFESGDQPTEQDFADLIDSFLLIDEAPDPLPAVDASQLVNIPIPDPLPAVGGQNLTGIVIREWSAVSPAPNYATTTTFVHSTDLTSTYIRDRRVRLTIDGGYHYSDVISSSYDSNTDVTTVTIADAMPSTGLTAVDVSVFTPANAGGAISPLMLGSMGGQFLVIENEPADMSVVVQSGFIKQEDGSVAIARQTTPIISAPTSNPRIDVIAVNEDDGSILVKTGTESATPLAPVISGRHFALAEVTINPADTVITNDAIRDVRALVSRDNNHKIYSSPPNLLHVNNATSSIGATALTHADLSDNGARFAILNIRVTATMGLSESGSCAASLYLGDDTSTGFFTISSSTPNVDTSTSYSISEAAQVIVPLDSLFQFFYSVNFLSTVGSYNITIDLGGYIT